jgi:hypothetical protein
VHTAPIGIFADNLDPHRFWAVVLQRWQTLDRFGMAVYEDQGFLLVNFDFDDNAAVREFRIHCRLWFYDYRYDDAETGVRRHEKLANDINRYFVQGVDGIDDALKGAMRDLLIATVKKGGAGIQ